LDSVSTGVKNWWWFIIKGLLLIAAGVAIFCKPLEGYLGLSILFSVVILGSGFTQIFFSSANSNVLKGWGWTMASGILDVIVGIYLLAYPAVTMVTLPFILGFWLMFRAFYLMGISFDLKNMGIPDWGWILFAGIAGLVFSFLILYYPAAGTISIIVVSGAAFIVAGIAYIYLAIKLKSVKGAFKEVAQKLHHA